MVHQPVDKALATAPSPSGMVGRFLKPQIRAQHEWPGFVTANDHIGRPPGLALVDEPMAQLHGAQRSSEATSFSISLAPAGTSEASKKAEMAFMQLAHFGQRKTKALSPTGAPLGIETRKEIQNCSAFLRNETKKETVLSQSGGTTQRKRLWRWRSPDARKWR